MWEDVNRHIFYMRPNCTDFGIFTRIINQSRVDIEVMLYVRKKAGMKLKM